MGVESAPGLFALFRHPYLKTRNPVGPLPPRARQPQSGGSPAPRDARWTTSPAGPEWTRLWPGSPPPPLAASTPGAPIGRGGRRRPSRLTGHALTRGRREGTARGATTAARGREAGRAGVAGPAVPARAPRTLSSFRAGRGGGGPRVRRTPPCRPVSPRGPGSVGTGAESPDADVPHSKSTSPSGITPILSGAKPGPCGGTTRPSCGRSRGQEG